VRLLRQELHDLNVGRTCLPRGIVSQRTSSEKGNRLRSCNHYFGAKLESVLLSHPLIALPLQLMGIPGKKGKARKKLSIYEREVVPDADITFPIAPPKVSYDQHGVGTWTFQPLVDKNFDMDCFRRALYHIGFNLVIANRGIEVARDERYAPLRNYVRRPRLGERWTFRSLRLPSKSSCRGWARRRLISRAGIFSFLRFSTRTSVSIF
jgi:hypothetical protein